MLNPFLSVEELLREILLDFGVVSREAVRSGRIIAASRARVDRDAARVPDVAGADRRAAASSSSTRRSTCHRRCSKRFACCRISRRINPKLLQIVLVGQLNLLDLLKQPQLKQLDQRVSLRAVLTPLGRMDLEAYVIHRLSVAGETGVRSRSRIGALDVVLRASGGVPRLINLICDRALMIGAQSDARVITTQMIDACRRQPRTATPQPARVRWWPGDPASARFGVARSIGVAGLTAF